ncbi:MAG: signal peptidase I [Pseudomonadota bacterium]
MNRTSIDAAETGGTTIPALASANGREAGPVAVGLGKEAKASKKAEKGGLGETVKVILQALLLALVVRTLLFQPFNIPSGSMKPTLLVGDYIFVSKFSYGYSRYSAPLGLPLFDGRIMGEAPERGDVAVFKLPNDPRIDYIKRVVGLPGERIQMREGVLFINDVAVEKTRVEDFQETSPSGRVQTVQRYIETLPNGVSYEVLDLTPNGLSDNTREYVVPEGHYFMMGDNRDNSTDSRVQGAVGFVPFENFVGRANVIFFSVRDGARAWELWRWPWTVRWDRLFDSAQSGA